jgi:signal transduction histidine kinase/ActR/RegA family two-component response regulator
VSVPEDGVPIDGDPDRIVQVFVNLLTNAAKYIPPDGRVLLTADVNGERVEIACEDNGPGVSAEMVPVVAVLDIGPCGRLRRPLHQADQDLYASGSNRVARPQCSAITSPGATRTITVLLERTSHSCKLIQSFSRRAVRRCTCAASRSSGTTYDPVDLPVRGPLSLRGHLVLLVVAAVLPGALLTGLIVRKTLKDNRAVLEHRLEDTARVDAAALDREFNATIRVLQALAQAPALDAGELQTFWSEARRVARTQPGWYAVILATPDSEVQLHSEMPFGTPLREAQDSERARLLEATRKPVVGQLAASRGGRLRFPISVPVERQGQLLYVLTAIMEPESLTAVVRTQLPETEEWTRAIVDPGLLIAARSRGGDKFIGRPVTPQGRELLRNRPERPTENTGLEGEPLYSSFGRSAFAGWTVIVSVPKAVLDGPVRESIVATASGGTVLILGGLLGVLLVSRRVSHDFEAARDAAAALAGGRTPVPSRPQVAEAKQVEASLQGAAQLLSIREQERDEQLHRAVLAQAEAEEANRTKDRFLAVLGHELRNPLAPALTALELMKLRGDGTVQREREVLERQISHMTRLVDDLLDVSRLTRGKVELVRQRFELRAAIDRTVDMAGPLIEQFEHALYVGVPETGLTIDADQDRIVQILVNLLTNAAKYTPPGGHLALMSNVVDGRVEIICEDDGPGVPADLLPTVFDPFTQGPRSIARQQGGLGLGLMLARSLSELHGGGLRYESVDPHGSRFIVSLPLSVAVRPPAPAAARESVHRRRRVLLVDDNVDALEMMRQALEHQGHQVQSAADGTVAMSAAAAFQPDVAVLDIGLPGMDGFDLARALRAALPQLRLIALTGYGQDSDARAARLAGFDAHCTKPVAISILLDQIDTCGAGPQPKRNCTGMLASRVDAQSGSVRPAGGSTG